MNSKLLALVFSLLAQNAFCVAYGDFVTSGPKDKPYIALTFDDGPGEVTKELLKILEAHKAKASFFILGSSLKLFPGMAKEISRSGHLLGNHTYSHGNFNKIPQEERKPRLAKEINETSNMIKAETGIREHFLRMPYGATKEFVLAMAKKRQYIVVNWDYGVDWMPRPKEELLKEYLDHLRPGAIFLFHDGGRRREITLWLIRNILTEADRRDLKAVRLDQLLHIAQPAK